MRRVDDGKRPSDASQACHRYRCVGHARPIVFWPTRAVAVVPTPRPAVNAPTLARARATRYPPNGVSPPPPEASRPLWHYRCLIHVRPSLFLTPPSQIYMHTYHTHHQTNCRSMPTLFRPLVPTPTNSHQRQRPPTSSRRRRTTPSCRTKRAHYGPRSRPWTTNSRKCLRRSKGEER